MRDCNHNLRQIYWPQIGSRQRADTQGYYLTRGGGILMSLAFAGIGIMTINTSILDKILIPDSNNPEISRWYDICMIVSLLASFCLRFAFFGDNTSMRAKRSDKFATKDSSYATPTTTPSQPEHTHKILLYVSLAVLILTQIAMLFLAISSNYS